MSSYNWQLDWKRAWPPHPQKGCAAWSEIWSLVILDHPSTLVSWKLDDEIGNLGRKGWSGLWARGGGASLPSSTATGTAVCPASALVSDYSCVQATRFACNGSCQNVMPAVVVGLDQQDECGGSHAKGCTGALGEGTRTRLHHDVKCRTCRALHLPQGAEGPDVRKHLKVSTPAKRRPLFVCLQPIVQPFARQQRHTTLPEKCGAVNTGPRELLGPTGWTHNWDVSARRFTCEESPTLGRHNNCCLEGIRSIGLLSPRHRAGVQTPQWQQSVWRVLQCM